VIGQKDSDLNIPAKKYQSWPLETTRQDLTMKSQSPFDDKHTDKQRRHFKMQQVTQQ
jgi:hypothetical protein